MSKEIAVPDYLKSMMAEGSVQDQTAQMQSDSGGVPRLTTKGKKFRLKEGENEEIVGDVIDVVIVGISPENGLAHTYYKDAYNPNSSEPPDCSSQNGVVPDSWITNPIHDKCADCPMQVWGSAKSMSGGKAKACRDSRHIFVATAKDFGENPEEATLYLMQVTVNSLRAFSNYGKELGGSGFPGPQFVITRLSMDEESSVPKVEFAMVGPLNETMGTASWARAQKKEWSVGVALPPPANDKRELPAPSSTQETQEVKSTPADLDDTDVGDLIDNW